MSEVSFDSGVCFSPDLSWFSDFSGSFGGSIFVGLRNVYSVVGRRAYLIL